jgi:NAD-dependent dihydropyrimidine dehydrogenase PreA subunit
MRSGLKIEICELRCKGCGFCVAVCHRGVLRMDGDRPVVAAPERCTGCELCVWICPDFAITISDDAHCGSQVGEK